MAVSAFPSAFLHSPEQKIAVPGVIERLVERVDSDEQRVGLVEAAGLHQRAGEEIHRADASADPSLSRSTMARNRALGLGEIAALVGAECALVLAVQTAGGRRRGQRASVASSARMQRVAHRIQVN